MTNRTLIIRFHSENKQTRKGWFYYGTSGRAKIMSLFDVHQTKGCELRTIKKWSMADLSNQTSTVLHMRSYTVCSINPNAYLSKQNVAVVCGSLL